jgi:4-amino-4-deoxy-L-arabinose transferase-like glycosyltransferase
MPRTAILFGVLLLVLGLGDYYGNTERHWLVVILPAFLGAAILVLGVAALIKRSWRRGAMHAAVIVGLVGFVATAHALFKIASMVLAEPTLLAESTMAILCGVFVVLSLKSFLVARLGRQETPPAPAPEAGQEPKN